MKKHKVMHKHKNNKAPETRKMQNILPPPQRLSRGDESSSGISVPHPVSNLLSAEQRNLI